MQCIWFLLAVNNVEQSSGRLGYNQERWSVYKDCFLVYKFLVTSVFLYGDGFPASYVYLELIITFSRSLQWNPSKRESVEPREKLLRGRRSTIKQRHWRKGQWALNRNNLFPPAWACTLYRAWRVLFVYSTIGARGIYSLWLSLHGGWFMIPVAPSLIHCLF